MKYIAPTESAIFLLKDVLGFQNELTESILEEAGKICNEVIAPTNSAGDIQGCRVENGNVTVPSDFREPWKQFAEGGWIGLSVPENYGGQGMPYVLASVVNEFVSSSNMAFSLYPGLTRGAIQAILTVGTEEQKQTFIPKMVTGEWTGTMNLTESHAGTDLGLMKTKAVDIGAGTYKITGEKIFISCGDQDLSDNIVHLVLARAEGDPAGVKGISLFIVPKLIDGKRNSVSVGSIEHKMGIHGSATCVMNYDDAIGYLIGERGQGLNAMFIMMNEMRLGCSLHGLSQSELAYQYAVSYAKDRIQSAKMTDPKGGSVSIIHHPDVRRMLMDIRCINEAARLLTLEAAILVEKEGDEDAEDLLGLMTPVLKGVLTDYGLENAVKAQQVFGGHGYIREHGIEQVVRDVRISQIYEGANGIQALDLVARKLPKNMGRGIRKFFDATAKHMGKTDNEFAPNVDKALNDLMKATQWLMMNAMKNPNDAGSASYDYMKLFGLVLLGVAHIRITDNTTDQTRLDNAQYFMERILPETRFLLKRIETGSDTMMKAEF